MFMNDEDGLEGGLQQFCGQFYGPFAENITDIFIFKLSVIIQYSCTYRG